TYNSMFAFTSLGGKVETERNDGWGPPQFILRGQNYHRLGSLLPDQGSTPKFAQLYIYDTINESANRIKHFRSEDSSTHVDPDLVDEIKVMVDTYNEIAKKIRQVRDHVEQGGTPNFSIRLFGKRSRDERMHNLPTCDEVAALIIGDQTDMENGRDIIVRNSSGEFKRLYETEPYFMPLQYPLLFPRSEDGFSPYIPFSTVNKPDKVHKRTSIVIREFIAFRIMDRTVEYGNIVNSR
ncbi:ATP-dependent DNA helicase PIF1, partial [Trifolium pratense]